MTQPIDASSSTMRADDGVDICVYRWRPSGDAPVRAVVQIAHGAAEHAARYDRIARVLAAEGYAVYADDHRAHGRTAGSVERACIAGPDGWNRMLADLKAITEMAAAEHPDKPIVFLGHSMGSMLGQAYAQRHGHGLSGLILSGTASSMMEGSEDLGERVEAAIEVEGNDAPSMDFAMLFAGFNEPFNESAPPPGPTGFEWLSRDHDEVMLYVNDPFCGFPFSNALVLDMAGGLEAIWAPGAEDRIPAGLPVLLIAGAEDPVGANGSVHALGERYRDVGLEVTEILYPGARHEIFNETNRDEVHADVVRWLDTHVPATP